MNYYKNDVCIVGAGSILPGSSSNDEFFKNLLAGQKLIRDVRVTGDKKRFDHFKFFVDPDKTENEKFFSTIASSFDPETLKRVALEHGLDLEKDPQLEIVTVGAMSQALATIKPAALDRRVETILGVMNSDGELAGLLLREWYDAFLHEIERRAPKKREYFQKLLDELMGMLPKPMPDWVPYVLPSILVENLKRRFKLRGPGQFVDAACASSLAALTLSMAKLRSGEADLVISGGIEANLNLGTFVVFTKVGALAENEALTAPFDRRSKGISQGEGAVVLVLQRLEDALRDGHEILGVVRSSGGSSDGRSSSLFQPTVEGQLLAFQRAYAGLESNRLDYLEGHGTGTEVGDTTELRSMATFFKDLSIPLGSTKALLGHTKSAAGAVSVLKCLLSMREKTVPGSPYFTAFPDGIQTDLFVNTKNLALKSRAEPLRMGVSSFGFGGTNFHVVLDEYKKDVPVLEARSLEKKRVLVCAEGAIDMEQFDAGLRNANLRLPPKSVLQVDRAQLIALLLVDQTFRKSRIRVDDLDATTVSVISASTTGLDSSFFVGQRLTAGLMWELTKTVVPATEAENRQLLNEVCDQILRRFPKTTEDSASGDLNNVIAGRVCNFFNFQGVNFNIDSDFASYPSAIEAARLKIESDGGMVVVVGIDEELIEEPRPKLRRKGARCMILASEEYAQKHDLPIACQLDRVTFTESAQ